MEHIFSKHIQPFFFLVLFFSAQRAIFPWSGLNGELKTNNDSFGSKHFTDLSLLQKRFCLRRNYHSLISLMGTSFHCFGHKCTTINFMHFMQTKKFSEKTTSTKIFSKYLKRKKVLRCCHNISQSAKCFSFVPFCHTQFQP